MGFLDKLRSLAGGAAPAPVSADHTPGVLCSPASGRVVALADVPDPVFAGEALGKGCAVWPDESTIYAPIAGTVTVAMPHAVGITGEDGVEVLVHIGIDTVEMRGSGFEVFVDAGSRVAAGQPIIRIDREKIREAGHPDCVVLAVSNSDQLSGVELEVTAGSRVQAGRALVKVVA